MTTKIGVITFPGTLDDVDAARAVRYAGADAVSLWHADDDLKGVDAVVVPGTEGDRKAYLPRGLVDPGPTPEKGLVGRSWPYGT